jgi:hypothetical protein
MAAYGKRWLQTADTALATHVPHASKNRNTSSYKPFFMPVLTETTKSVNKQPSQFPLIRFHENLFNEFPDVQTATTNPTQLQICKRHERFQTTYFDRFHFVVLMN